MQFSADKIERYKEIYFEIYGKVIDTNQAFSELSKLVLIMEATYKSINKIKT